MSATRGRCCFSSSSMPSAPDVTRDRCSSVSAISCSPIVEAHRERLAQATGWHQTIELWRSECMDAVLVFTEKLLAAAADG